MSGAYACVEGIRTDVSVDVEGVHVRVEDVCVRVSVVVQGEGEDTHSI